MQNHSQWAAGEHKQERRAWVWIMLMVNIAFLLILMAIGILALRVGNYLPEGTDIIFIVGKAPSVETGDGEGGAWEAGKEIDIFKASYVNGEGVATVASQDGTALIAPGTKTTYEFAMYNNGNMAVVYETDIDFLLRIGDEAQAEYTFPLMVRLSAESGQYLIGDEDTWVNVEEARLSQHVSVLGASSYEAFTLELMWEFDGGNDTLDTMYGDQSVEKGVSLTLGINTYAEEHLDPTAKGGIPVESEDGSATERGGTIRWIWLLLLLVNTAVVIFYISWLLNKRLRKW